MKSSKKRLFRMRRVFSEPSLAAPHINVRERSSSQLRTPLTTYTHSGGWGSTSPALRGAVAHQFFAVTPISVPRGVSAAAFHRHQKQILLQQINSAKATLEHAKALLGSAEIREAHQDLKREAHLFGIDSRHLTIEQLIAALDAELSEGDYFSSDEGSPRRIDF